MVGEADRRVDRPAQLAVLGDARALARQLAYLVGVAGTPERIIVPYFKTFDLISGE